MHPDCMCYFDSPRDHDAAVPVELLDSSPASGDTASRLPHLPGLVQG